MGMRRDFPQSCNGVEAPRMVVFEVINLKRGKGKPMTEVIREGAVRVGVDLAKRVIQVQAVDAKGRVATSKALRREQFLPWCARLPEGSLVVMEASSSAHHWCRR